MKAQVKYSAKKFYLSILNFLDMTALLSSLPRKGATFLSEMVVWSLAFYQMVGAL